MDDVLIGKVLDGNDHAFRVIVEKYRNHVFRTVFGVLRNEKDAEDAAQEVFMKVYTSLPKYESQGFKTWITRIAVNHAIDMKRKKAVRQEEATSEYEEAIHAPAGESAEDTAISTEMKRQVFRKIEELPESYKDVVKGFYIHEHTYEELADRLDLQVKTVEMRLYRARQWMKKHWKEDDFS